MPESEEDFTLRELARGQNAVLNAIKDLDKEVTEGHNRLRHDVANLQVSVGAAHERDRAHDRDITNLGDLIRAVQGDHKWLIRAILGAYGAVVLTALGILLSRGP